MQNTYNAVVSKRTRMYVNTLHAQDFVFPPPSPPFYEENAKSPKQHPWYLVLRSMFFSIPIFTVHGLWTVEEEIGSPVLRCYSWPLWPLHTMIAEDVATFVLEAAPHHRRFLLCKALNNNVLFPLELREQNLEMKRSMWNSCCCMMLQSSQLRPFSPTI